MKTAAIIVITVILSALCLTAFAAQFPDVPTDHWAYAAVQDLSDKGVIQGYPDGTFAGKRALTRYEFAQALSRAIPVIAKLACSAGAAGQCGPCGPQGPAGPAGPPGITPEQIANFQRLLDEFKDELAAQGVDIAALKKDVAALADRVSAVEAEQARVKINAEVPFIARGLVLNGTTPGFDRDGRSLGGTPNPIQSNSFFNDFELGIKGRVSNSASVTALVAAGNYLPFALNSPTFGPVNEFALYNLYMSAAMNLGPLGSSNVTVGRFPFQLTPLTLKFVAPDCYGYVSKLQNGDFALDGGALAFKVGPATITGFAADRVASLGINQPYIQAAGSLTGIPVPTIAGARAVIGTPWVGNLGLTYMQLGANTVAGVPAGRAQVYGGDINGTFAKIGFNGEFDQFRPSGILKGAGIPNTQNNAWNAALSYQWGNLGLGAGYQEVQRFYSAPGAWSRLGRAANLQNVKGGLANISYAITPRIAFYGDGSFYTKVNGAFPFVAREAIFTGDVVAVNANKVYGFKGGLKYALTSTNTIDLGVEQVQWGVAAGTVGGGTRENYYSIGYGHTFNSNANLKLLYQIVDYKVGAINPYAFDTAGTYRGGVATAEFQLKY